MKINRLRLKLAINILVSAFALCGLSASAQEKIIDKKELKVLARTSVDSIVLRWAPMDVSSWINGNKFGYTIERYVVVRDKKVLKQPERKLLTTIPIKPLPLERWEPLVKQNKYAAIAAQSLYGDSFELTTQGTDVFKIVNKVKENEQRFSFALFSADLSVPVSYALGLRFTDRDVRAGEKYLYRIKSIPMQTGYDTLKGSVFVGPEKYMLPAPLNFAAEFKGPIVSLKWNQFYHKGIYSAYSVERSANGKDFVPISDEPLVTLSEDGKQESRFQYATDSLPDNVNEYHYRVRGLSPFGETGPPSEVVKGKGSVSISATPRIIKGFSENNKTIRINWEFPDELNSQLKGFDVYRSHTPKDLVIINQQSIKASERSFEDISAKQTNYYQVVATSLSNERFKSPLFYAQLVDSFPPAHPVGLNGKINDKGQVSLSWLPNKEEDIYGYRIYRGNYLKEEFSQITTEPIRQTYYVDSVNLKTLNHNVHYQVMAIDVNQNYSALSEVLTLTLPDKVKPAPPVFLPSISSREGVTLEWQPSGSDDVVRYDIYRNDGQRFEKIAFLFAMPDSVYRYVDKASPEGKSSTYTVIAVDDAGLESDAATPITAAKILNPIKPQVILRTPDVDRVGRKISLKWKYEVTGVTHYQVYRAKEEEPLKLYTTIAGTSQSFEDKQVQMNSTYRYRVIALFSSGAKSEFSGEVVVKY